MINFIETTLLAERCTLQEAALTPEAGIEYWHTTVIDKSGMPLSGGFAQDKNQSRKIAVAEYLERKLVREIYSCGETERSTWGLDIIPTACGFAGGFNANNTRFRSIAEAAERWVMSKWIDEGYFIEQLSSQKVEENLDPISKFIASKFDNVLYFSKDVLIPIGDQFIAIKVCQTMGLLGGGIFPGSSAQLTGGTIWQHALIESYRHLLAAKNNTVNRDLFPFNRINYFAKNAAVALTKIAEANRTSWPIPKVILHRTQEYYSGNFYLSRTILDGWESWHLGPIDRFVY